MIERYDRQAQSSTQFDLTPGDPESLLLRCSFFDIAVVSDSDTHISIEITDEGAMSAAVSRQDELLGD